MHKMWVTEHINVLLSKNVQFRAVFLVYIVKYSLVSKMRFSFEWDEFLILLNFCR